MSESNNNGDRQSGGGGVLGRRDPGAVIAGLSGSIETTLGTGQTESAETATSVDDDAGTDGGLAEAANAVTATELDESAGSTPASEPDLALDQLFEILKNRRRREVLKYLDRNGGEATLGSLAEYIAAEENDTTVKQITSSQRKRVYVGLYQCHLPKMDDMDIVDFEKNRGTIEVGPNARLLEPYLQPGGGERDEHRIYAGVAATGFLLAVLAAATVGSAATAGISLLTVVAIGATAIEQLRRP